MTRLFTFGCSFTKFYWPTWADILGQEFDYYENWGEIAGGNQFIFNSIIECNQRNKFTPNDTIIVMWSTILREDRYIQNRGGWFLSGNIYFAPVYSEKQKKELLCERGFLIRDLSTISAAKNLLEFWNVNYYMSSIMQFEVVYDDVMDLYQSALLDFKPTINDSIAFEPGRQGRNFFTKLKTPSKHDVNNLKDRYNLCKGKEWPKFEVFFNGDYIDPVIKEDIKKYNLYDIFFSITHEEADHPSPAEHLLYVQKVFKEFTVSDKTVSWINNFKYGDQFKQHLPTHRL